MRRLSGHAWMEVARCLPMQDIASASSVSSEWRRSWSDPQIWRDVAHRLRGAEFWHRARRRPAVSSKPLGSWRREVQRLARFDRVCVDKLGKRLPNRSLYVLWQVIDATPVTGVF